MSAAGGRQLARGDRSGYGCAAPQAPSAPRLQPAAALIKNLLEARAPVAVDPGGSPKQEQQGAHVRAQAAACLVARGMVRAEAAPVSLAGRLLAATTNLAGDGRASRSLSGPTGVVHRT